MLITIFHRGITCISHPTLLLLLLGLELVPAPLPFALTLALALLLLLLLLLLAGLKGLDRLQGLMEIGVRRHAGALARAGHQVKDA
jgi:hypothetical protein